MPDKDINIHVRAQDTAETKRQIDQSTASVYDLWKAVGTGARQGAEGTEKATEKLSFLGSLLSKVGSYALGFFGITKAIQTMTAAIRDQSDAIKEHAQIAMEQQNKLLRLQFLGDYYKEKPQLRKEVMALSEAGRRSFEDVANAMYDLRNLGGGLTATQQEDILSKSLELGRTMPETPLAKIVQSMVFYIKQTRNKDIGSVQNIIKQTLTEAGGEPGEAAADLSKFLPIGLSAGMTGPEAAGTWAYATSQFPEAGRATTALSGIIMALQGKGTDDSKRLLRRFGISPGASFLQQIQQLSQKQLTLKQIETIASVKEAPILAALLQNPEAMMKTIGGITAAGLSKEDLAAKSIEGLYGQDEMAILADISKLSDIKIENIKGLDIKATRLEAEKKLFEAAARKEKIPELLIKYINKMNDLYAAVFGITISGTVADIQEKFSKGENEPNRPVTVNNNYDSSTNYHPTVGETEANRWRQD
jgi:hypothetical protein